MAITLTLAGLRDALGSVDTQQENDRLTRLLDLTKAHVERYAPDAPVHCQNEAVIRLSGYLHDVPRTPAMRSWKVGDGVAVGYVPNFDAGRAFRLSGAQAILEPWRSLTARNVGV